MTFDHYLTLLIEFTESRALVMARQSEAWSCFCQSAPVEYCGEFLMAVGMPKSNKK